MRKKVSIGELKNRVAFLRRNLLKGGMVTEDELTSAASRFKEFCNKDALWEEWAYLKTLAMSRAKVRKGKTSEDALNVAVKALADKPVEVILHGMGETFHIHPASWMRIQVVEEHDWWVNRLIAARSIIFMNTNMGVDDKTREVCSECKRPTAPGNMAGTLKRIRKEINYQRGMLYANIVAEGPAPVDEPVKWANHITAMDEMVLKETYHRVNYDTMKNLPSPRSEKGEGLPNSWAFLFSSLEEREKKPAIHFMRDRSLGSLVASIVLKTIRDQAVAKKMESKRKKA